MLLSHESVCLKELTLTWTDICICWLFYIPQFCSKVTPLFASFNLFSGRDNAVIIWLCFNKYRLPEDQRAVWRKPLVKHRGQAAMAHSFVLSIREVEIERDMAGWREDYKAEGYRSQLIQSGDSGRQDIALCFWGHRRIRTTMTSEDIVE